MRKDNILMTKANLIKEISKKAGITQEQAAQALNAALEGIQAAVVAGDRINFSGFGTFEARQRSAKEGINHLTGEAYSIPEYKVPAFKASQSFKDLVKG